MKVTTIKMKRLNIFKIAILIIFCFLSACHKHDDPAEGSAAYPVTTFVGQEGDEIVMLNWEPPKEGSPSVYMVS